MLKMRYICVSILFLVLACCFISHNLTLADLTLTEGSLELKQAKNAFKKARKVYNSAQKEYENCQELESDWKTLGKLRKEVLRSFEREKTYLKSTIRSAFNSAISSSAGGAEAKNAVRRIGTDIERAFDAYYNKLKNCISHPPCSYVTHSFTLTASVRGYTVSQPVTLDSRQMKHQKIINQMNGLVRKDPSLKRLRLKPGCLKLKAKADKTRREMKRLEGRVVALERQRPVHFEKGSEGSPPADLSSRASDIPLLGVHTLETAKRVAAERFEGWKYAKRPRKKKHEINCTIFLEAVVQEELKLPPNSKERTAINKAINISLPPEDEANLESLVESNDERTRGVQYALVDLTKRGIKIAPEDAQRGDLIQYWYKAGGKWEGHAGVISKVIPGNPPRMFLYGAHEKLKGIGEERFVGGLRLRSEKRKVYITRIKPPWYVPK